MTIQLDYIYQEFEEVQNLEARMLVYLNQNGLVRTDTDHLLPAMVDHKILRIELGWKNQQR